MAYATGHGGKPHCQEPADIAARARNRLTLNAL